MNKLMPSIEQLKMEAQEVEDDKKSEEEDKQEA